MVYAVVLLLSISIKRLWLASLAPQIAHNVKVKRHANSAMERLNLRLKEFVPR